MVIVILIAFASESFLQSQIALADTEIDSIIELIPRRTGEAIQAMKARKHISACSPNSTEACS